MDPISFRGIKKDKERGKKLVFNKKHRKR